MKFLSLFPDPEEFPPITQAEIGREPIAGMWGHLLRRNGGGQVFTTTGSAAFQNKAAVFSLHSLAKAVGSFAANSTWLISAFHW